MPQGASFSPVIYAPQPYTVLASPYILFPEVCLACTCCAAAQTSEPSKELESYEAQVIDLLMMQS
jgi:hypothetical protein